jgi:hypothetical protein
MLCHLPREIDALKVGGPNPRLYLFAKSLLTGSRLSNELSLRIAAVTLTFGNLRLGLSPFVGGKRSSNIYGFSKRPVGFSTDITFVSCMRLGELPFTTSSFRHVFLSDVFH